MRILALAPFAWRGGGDRRAASRRAPDVIPLGAAPPPRPLDPLADDDLVLLVGNFRHTPSVDGARRSAETKTLVAPAERRAARPLAPAQEARAWAEKSAGWKEPVERRDERLRSVVRRQAW